VNVCVIDASCVTDASGIRYGNRRPAWLLMTDLDEIRQRLLAGPDGYKILTVDEEDGAPPTHVAKSTSAAGPLSFGG